MINEFITAYEILIHAIQTLDQNKLRLPPTNPISEIRSSESVRSTASILAVIREHSRGLRHIYNTYLKTERGLKGKVSLRFTIAPSGQVVDVSLNGSTTGAPDFDKQVSSAILGWRFEAVKSIGNDVVTVPFNFSE